MKVTSNPIINPAPPVVPVHIPPILPCSYPTRSTPFLHVLHINVRGLFSYKINLAIIKRISKFDNYDIDFAFSKREILKFDNYDNELAFLKCENHSLSVSPFENVKHMVMINLISSFLNATFSKRINTKKKHLFS